MAKPDIHGLAIEFAAKKGLKPTGGDEPEADPVTPDQLDDAHEMLEAMKTGDAQTFAHSLCNFLDSYHGGGEDESEGESEEPDAAAEG